MDGASSVGGATRAAALAGMLVLAAGAPASTASAFTPPAAPAEFVTSFELGGGTLLGPFSNWTGICTRACGNLWKSMRLPMSVPANGFGGAGLALGADVGITPWLSLQILVDGQLTLGRIEQGPPTVFPSSPELTFQIQPGWEFGPLLLVDLPVDLRVRLGLSWDLFAGVAPGYAAEAAKMRASGTPLEASFGQTTGGIGNGAWTYFVRAGVDRAFNYRSAAIGALVEWAPYGAVAILATFSLRFGRVYEAID